MATWNFTAKPLALLDVFELFTGYPAVDTFCVTKITTYVAISSPEIIELFFGGFTLCIKILVAHCEIIFPVPHISDL